MAAEQLYDTLPKETRRQLRDLPDVVHRLEQDAQRMRARLEELQEALADVGQRGNPDASIAARHDRIVADLSAERDLVQQRLKDAVAALETIRLNLLRLHAGSGSVHSLTTDLGLARNLARDIDAQVDGYREVEGELQR
jgi:serine/threonine-protein kinase